MVNITDPDLADTIIALEREFVSTNTGWEEDVRAEILRMQEDIRNNLPILTNSGDGMIYGSHGLNRYSIYHDGQVSFILDLCTYQIDDEEKIRRAKAKGFDVI